MKLLICLECVDIFNLTRKQKSCGCGKTKGKYIDDKNAEISGPCEPLGFSNSSFVKSLKMQQIENKHQENKTDVCCKGIPFEAFIIPDWAKTVKRIKK